MLKLKLQYFGHLIRRVYSLEKTLMLGKTEGRRRRGQRMVGWHHGFNGHKFEQALGDSEGQGSLACCSSWDCKQSDMTEQLNNNYAKKPGWQILFILQCKVHNMHWIHLTIMTIINSTFLFVLSMASWVVARDHMAHKTKNIYYLALYRSSLPTLNRVWI